ncbi:MAG: glycosyltransferase family 2 protein [Syntrophomonas sp.]
MELSIIIVNWNTREMLRNCLSSLKDHTGRHKVKVFVVDNASKDGSVEMVHNQFPWVYLINSGGNIGFGKANNLAKPYSYTPYILFLNPDTIILNDAITEMLDYMETNQDVGALGCKMKYPDGVVQPLGLQWFPTPFTELISMLIISQRTQKRLKSYLPYVDPNKNSVVSKLYGGCLMVRKSVLDQVGWFDERFFMYGEDVDLCKRITEAGWKLYYLSDTQIIHLCGGASGEAPSNFSVLMKCESISKLMRKYYGNTGALLYKLVILSGSSFRLFVLAVLKIASSLLKKGNNSEYKNTHLKYVAMIKWCLNFQKPEIKS